MEITEEFARNLALSHCRVVPVDDQNSFPFVVPAELIREALSAVSGLGVEERAKWAFDTVHCLVRYDYSKANKINHMISHSYKGAGRVLGAHKGVCGEQTYLLVALARAIGLGASYASVHIDHNGQSVTHACAVFKLMEKHLLADPAYGVYDVNHQLWNEVADARAWKDYCDWNKRPCPEILNACTNPSPPEFVAIVDASIAVRGGVKTMTLDDSISRSSNVEQECRTDLFKGQNIDGYLLEEEVGRGSFGVVWRAHDTSRQRKVAIKFLFPIGRVERFEREIEALQRIRSPHIPSILGYGRHADYTFIVMDLVCGKTIRDLLTARGRFFESEVQWVATLALRALSDAHRQGVLHRDIKPENLMVVGVLGAPGGNLVLLDFGLAKFYETYSDILSSKARNRTSVAGTPLYMAPEVAAGNSPSCQSDIYSLGLVLHELISGAKPQFRERPKFPLLGVSDRLNHIVFRAVCDLPSQRWSSAQEMLSALLSTAEIQTSAISVQTPNITTEWTFPTNPVPRFGTIAFLVGTLGIIGFLIVGHGMHWATGDSTWIRSNNDLVPSYSKRPLRLTEGNSLVYFDLEGRELRRFSFEDHVDVAYEKLTRIVERHLPHGASTELRVRREFEILNRWDCSPRDGVISRHEYRE